MISLDKYLSGKKKELEALTDEVSLLEKVNAQVKVDIREAAGEVILYCEDYHLAEDFTIRKRSESISSSSNPGGSYSTDRYDTYPEFYFNLTNGARTIQVYLTHRGFETDKRVVIKSITRTQAWGSYSGDEGSRENHVNPDSVISFFRKKGVPNSLLIKLKQRMNEASEI